MRILRLGWYVLSNIGLILSGNPPFGKGTLLLTYLRLRLKQLFYIGILRQPILTETFLGYQVKVLDYSAFVHLFEEVFLENQYYFEHESSSPYIIDCGSNMGMAVLYFKKLFPDCRIFAFEPNKSTYEVLKYNVGGNGLTNVEFRNNAVHNTRGTITFYHAPQDAGNVYSSIRKERLRNASSEEVETIVLSDFVKEPVAFLKMDIEGAEGVVIEELAEKGRLGNVEQMVIEYHHHIDPGEEDLSKFLGLLETSGLGYQISGWIKPPFKKGVFQDLLIYAYKK